MIKHFVLWIGNIEKDPMAKGCECFDTPEEVVAFVKRETNKGYLCSIFLGQLVWPVAETSYEAAVRLVSELFGKR